MDSTSFSLLDRLSRSPRPQDWERLVAMYQPWIFDWLRRQDLQDHDAADLTQDVLSVLIRELPSFKYQRDRGRFRSWLRTITANRLRAFWKSRRRFPVATDEVELMRCAESLADASSPLSQQWDQEHDQHVVQQALALIRSEFRAETWDVFHRVAIEGQPPEAVAQSLGITKNAVYIAQSRVLKRLRQETLGLCD